MMLGLGPYFAEEYFDVETPKPRRARTVPQSEAVAKSPGRLSTRGADIVYESPGKELPRAVMFRDSFATSLIPFLVDHFQRITFSWQYTFDRELVEKEHPDVVIQEMVERTLMIPRDVFLTR